MLVKRHRVLTGTKADDPALYADMACLVGRHDEWTFAMVGAWRWPVIAKHGALIKELVTAGYTIDFGGAAAPVGYGATVVDYQMPAPDGPRSLADVPGFADCVFCSHTLEHFVDPRNALASIRHKLKLGGSLVLQVPGWQKYDLHASRWPYHETTFCLAFETNAPEYCERVDTMVADAGFRVELTDELDGNILVIARAV